MNNYRTRNLRIWNFVVGLVLAIEALLIGLLTNNFALPVTATYMSGPPGTKAQSVHLLQLSLGWGVFSFVLISSIALFAVTLPRVFKWYIANLENNRNYARWIEYFFSSSIMIVLITMLTGVSDIAALIAIFGVNACMILFGLLIEMYETPGKTKWLSYYFGCFAGIIPWLIVAIYVFTPGFHGPSPPGFVYGIIASEFVLFNIFALNMWLQYKQIGKWRDYVYGEKAYIMLSLTAKSLLAWWVFAAVLIK